jgi:glutamate dehydrogenase/leucine dehydrogenase
LKIDRKKIKFAIQGFGNVGSIAAELLSKNGSKICAISDVSTGLYNPKGLDISDILSYINSESRPPLLKDYNLKKDDVFISNEELLELEIDVLIPAALENQIHVENADNIKAKIIVEGANGPVSKKADEILAEKEVQIIPDILANSGGVIVSYFEWVQGIQSFFWDIGEVNNNLKKNYIKKFC